MSLARGSGSGLYAKADRNAAATPECIATEAAPDSDADDSEMDETEDPPARTSTNTLTFIERMRTNPPKDVAHLDEISGNAQKAKAGRIYVHVGQIVMPPNGPVVQRLDSPLP
ncbi:hypothetical protein B0H13DRAFT_2301285 [Mycena leptocephala]|nr:hypothetical protein B0H13DRAFT_2301285 [Mycena leptocephala]